MNKEQALQVIEQALNAANKGGVFNLQDSATIQVALNTIKQLEEFYKPNVQKVEDKPLEVKPVKTK